MLHTHTHACWRTETHAHLISPTCSAPLTGRPPAGEGECTLLEFARLHAAGLSYLQPDIAMCGGLTVCKAISDLIEASPGSGCTPVPHCFSTGVNLCASLHWMAATGGDLCEYCMSPSPLMRSLVSNLPPLGADGRVDVPTGPGLGLELDPAILEEYRVRDDRARL